LGLSPGSVAPEASSVTPSGRPMACATSATQDQDCFSRLLQQRRDVIWRLG
jgi:hypothetical protein